MTLKLNGTNSVAAPAYAGDDADTGLQCGTNELKLVTGGTERVKVDSSGNVGINTTTPFSDAELTVGNGGSGNASIALRRTGSGQNDWAFSNQGGELKVLGGGDATTIGGLSELVRFQSAGGISFNGDTAAANALSDYEEGSWSPSITFGGGNTSLNLNVADGHYIKIGNFVYCNFILAFINKGTSTGELRLTGLPFTAGDNLASTILESGGMFTFASNISGSIEPPFTIVPEHNSTVAAVKCGVGNELNTNMTNSNFNNNTSTRGFFSYITS